MPELNPGFVYHWRKFQDRSGLCCAAGGSAELYGGRCSGRIVKRNDVRVTWNTMDQIHLPDPVFDDIETLKHENTELTNRVLELERELKFMKKENKDEVL